MKLPGGFQLVRGPGGRALPSDQKVTTAEQAIARLSAATSALPLPQAPGMNAPFGPSSPLRPAAIDPLQPWGRPLPRRAQYDVSVNLDLGHRPEIPFQVLKAVASPHGCALVRRCIDIRKQAIQAKKWDIALTPAATGRLMAKTGESNREKAERMGRVEYASEIERLRDFMERPDPDNRMSWSQWIGAALEEHFVWDAWTVYPRMGANGKVEALWILDGSTIKPLRDEYGNIPNGNFAAYQQILWGFPRGEFIAGPDSDAEFRADQLFYRPRDVRSGSPYGSSPTEKALPLANLWMRRNGWLLSEYTEGTLPAAVVYADAQMNAQDRRQQEAWLNEDLAGDDAARHRMLLMASGFKVQELTQADSKYTSAYDDWLTGQIGSYFAVMPTQLGIIPKTYGIMGQGRMSGEQDVSETLGDQPLEEWLIDTLNEMMRLYLGMPKDLTFAFDAGGIDQDDNVRATTDQVRTNSGQLTLNEVRAANGDALYAFPEADIPFVMTAAGPKFLPGASEPDPVPAPLAPGKETVDTKPETAGGSPAEAEPDAKAEVQKFVTFAERRQGRTWRDFEFAALEPDLAKVLNAAGQRGDLEACRVLAATLPKAQAGQSRHRLSMATS